MLVPPLCLSSSPQYDSYFFANYGIYINLIFLIMAFKFIWSFYLKIYQILLSEPTLICSSSLSSSCPFIEATS
jgi:hypothetical protein